MYSPELHAHLQQAGVEGGVAEPTGPKPKWRPRNPMPKKKKPMADEGGDEGGDEEGGEDGGKDDDEDDLFQRRRVSGWRLVREEL